MFSAAGENAALAAKAGIIIKATCLSYARQDIDREPTKHPGAKVRARKNMAY